MTDLKLQVKRARLVSTPTLSCQTIKTILDDLSCIQFFLSLNLSMIPCFPEYSAQAAC